MKIKTLSRSLDNHAPSKLGDAAPQSRNLDPNLHPFDKPREYTRALNAAKLDRLFAKPFVASLDGHIDGVYSLATDLRRLNFVASGSGDGEIRLWDLSQQSLIHRYPKAHSGIIQSLCVSPLSFSNSQDGGGARRLLSCSTDRTIKLWDADPFPSRSGWAGEAEDEDEEQEDENGMDMTSGGKLKKGGLLSSRDAEISKSEPITSWSSKTAFNSLSHHQNKPIFASSASSIQIWDLARGAISSGSETSALQNLSWGAESINVVKFNPSETEVLVSAGSDRGVLLYDLRSGKPITKMIMKMRANDLAWNPIEPTTFALASEDHNLYTFDMRNLTSATQIYKDHVAAVMSVNYSPTGQELVSGSYDRTLRLWSTGQGSHSRDIYHTKRMQRIFTVSHTLDARFVLTGSDDGNVRLWKSKASEALGIRSGKDRAAREYSDALRQKWRESGDVKKIERQRHVPKVVKGAQKLKRTMLEAERVKEDRRRKHTKKGEAKPTAARKGAILAHKE